MPRHAMPCKVRELLSDRRGQDILEWTVALPIFMMVVMGLVIYGWYWWNQTTAATAIHDGTYLAARRGGSLAQGLARIDSLLRAALGGYAQGYDYSITPDPGQRSMQGAISNDRVIHLPFVGDLLFHVRASSFQRWEQFYGGPPTGWW